jgi:tetratricopeptide (TPR) repeat protein
VPYGFVRSGTASWATKPIGHLPLSLAALLLIRHAISAATPKAIRFNAVMDPGFFPTDETQAVTQALSAVSTPTILLPAQEASFGNLSILAAHLPLELLYINTHGNEKSMQLHSDAWEGFQVEQMVRLNSLPVVFNNSCISWTGVGASFIRAGARGYLGTLWSVHADRAAAMARTIMSASARAEVPLAASLARAASDHSSDRAYIYIGPVGALLRYDEAATADTHAQFSRIDTYLAALGEMSSLDVPMHGTTPERLYRAIQSQCTALLADENILPEDRLPLGILELGVVLGHFRSFQLTGKEADQLVAHCERLHGQYRATPDLRATAELDIARKKALLLEHRGDIPGAIAIYEAGVAGPAHQSKIAASGWLHLGYSNLLRALHEWDAAESHARTAREILRDTQDTYHELRALGTLGQLLKRKRQFEDALKLAEEGLALARRVHDRNEEVAFAMDVAQLTLVATTTGTRTAAQALAAAREARKTAAANSHTTGQLKAMGLEGGSLRAAGDFAEARRVARAGLAIAKALEDRQEILSFTLDLGMVHREFHEWEEALARFQETVIQALISDELEKLPLTLSLALEVAESSGRVDLSYRTLWQHVQMLCKVPERAQHIMVPILVNHLKKRAAQDPAPMTLAGVSLLLEALMEGVTSRPTDHPGVLYEVLHLIRFALVGDRVRASEIAQSLDEVTGNAFESTAWLATPLPSLARPIAARERRG